jgi:uncharacterized membrane protein YfcA
LLFAGVTPIAANATNTIALWPAGLASTAAYRKDLTAPRSVMVTLGLASFVGGGLGAALLLITKDSTFVALIPWLLLLASVVFTWGGRVAAILRRRAERSAPNAGNLADDAKPPPSLRLLALLQFIIAVYGGYFGGGMGILMLAAFSLLGIRNIHEANGLKAFLGVLINGVGAVTFALAGAVVWAPGVVMIAGALAGGYLGALGARRISPARVRVFALVVAWGMTAYFLWKTYGPHA